MNIDVIKGNIQDTAADTIVVNLFEDVVSPSGATGAVDRALDGAISEVIANGDFSGKPGEIAVLYPRGAMHAKRVLVVGLGKPDGFDLEGVRKAAATAIKKAGELSAENVATIVHGAGIAGLPVASSAQATVLGSLLASYEYKADKLGQDDKNSVERWFEDP
jgi:leucyl aminopeptidase